MRRKPADPAGGESDVRRAASRTGRRVPQDVLPGHRRAAERPARGVDQGLSAVLPRMDGTGAVGWGCGVGTGQAPGVHAQGTARHVRAARESYGMAQAARTLPRRGQPSEVRDRRLLEEGRRIAPGRRAFRCRKHPATGGRNEKARLVKRRAFVRSCERGKLVLMGRAVFAGHGGDVDADDAHVVENGLRGGTRTGSAVALRDGVQRLAFFGDIFNDGGPARAADGFVVGGGFLPGDFHVGGDAEPDPSVAGDQFHLRALGGRMEIELTVKVHEIDRDDIGMLFRGDGQEQGFGLRK